jgi:serine/threonine-protein kinase
VFRALSDKLQKQIAIKTVDLTRFDATGRSAFSEDAQRLVALNHPGIVPVYDILMRETDAIIIMEYVDCATLMDAIARLAYQQPEEAILSGARLIGQVAQTLSYAHANKVVHRTLTPHKIFVHCGPTQSMPRVAGFALGPLPEMVGTPVYQYPDPEPDERSDIFSLGAILLEMLTGRTMANLGLLWLLHLQQEEETASLSQLNPLIPSGIERICSRCLQTSAARRYQNASELAEDLENESKPRRRPILRFLRRRSN